MPPITIVKNDTTQSALNLHAAIIGQSGEGKSYLARGLVEGLLDEKRQVVILDPTGVWWGLRAGADGGPKGGYPIAIFGGEHADVQLSAASGAQLGALLGGRAISAVVDVSEFEDAEAQIAFVTDFLRALYRTNKKPIHLVVDEADEFAPEVKTVEGASGALDQMARIVKRGRIRGFRMLMITQRPADIAKRVLAAAKAMFLKKVALELDHKAVNGWVRSNCTRAQAEGIMSSLGKLKRTEAWVVVPGESTTRTPVTKIRTFDSMRAPEVGDIQIEPETLADVDAGTLGELLAATETGTVLGSASVPPAGYNGPTPAQIAAKIESAREEGYRRGSEDMAARLRTAIDKGLGPEASAPRAAKIPVPLAQPSPTVTAPAPAKKTAQEFREAARPTLESVKDDNLLAAAVEIDPVRVSWAALATMAGIKARGGHFNGKRKRLLDSGALIEGPDGLLRVHSDLQDPKLKSRSPKAVLLDVLPQPSQRMFAYLIANPNSLLEDMALDMGVKPYGGHWNGGLALLRNNGLIACENNRWRISPELEKKPSVKA